MHPGQGSGFSQGLNETKHQLSLYSEMTKHLLKEQCVKLTYSNISNILTKVTSFKGAWGGGVAKVHLSTFLLTVLSIIMFCLPAKS